MKRLHFTPLLDPLALGTMLMHARGDESRRAVADRSGVSYMQLRNIELGLCLNPGLETLMRIANATGRATALVMASDPAVAAITAAVPHEVRRDDIVLVSNTLEEFEGL